MSTTRSTATCWTLKFNIFHIFFILSVGTRPPIPLSPLSVSTPPPLPISWRITMLHVHSLWWKYSSASFCHFYNQGTKKPFKNCFCLHLFFSFLFMSHRWVTFFFFFKCELDQGILLESCILLSFRMCWCVLIAASYVSVFRDLCLHMGNGITVPMATRSGACFWDCRLTCADVVQQRC